MFVQRLTKHSQRVKPFHPYAVLNSMWESPTFEKQQDDQCKHSIRGEYNVTQWMRKVLRRPLQPTVDKGNALLLSGACAKWKYLLACILGRQPKQVGTELFG